MAFPRQFKCQVAARADKAMREWPDDITCDAASYESMGWDYAIQSAPRCHDRNCEVCHD